MPLDVEKTEAGIQLGCQLGEGAKRSLGQVLAEKFCIQVSERRAWIELSVEYRPHPLSAHNECNITGYMCIYIYIYTPLSGPP